MTSKSEDLLVCTHQVLRFVMQATVSPKTGWGKDELVYLCPTSLPREWLRVFLCLHTPSASRVISLRKKRGPARRKTKSLNMLHKKKASQIQLAQLHTFQGQTFSVRKRDGRVVAFDQTRIALAIAAAFKADAGLVQYDALPIETQASVARITNAVVQIILSRAVKGEILEIESIQDLVEQHLMEAGYHGVAKRYILYREERRRLRLMRDVGEPLVPTVSSIDEYLSEADWRVNANANQGYSLGGMILNVSGKVTAIIGCITFMAGK
jgi:hypothetical protein